MLEILFLCGLVGALVGAIWEYVTSLAAFPTLVAAFITVPLLACADYLRAVQRLELAGLHQQREPVPPERFYWKLHQVQLRRSLYVLGTLAGVAWVAALKCPAQSSLTASSTFGWLSGAAAIVSTARVIAWAVVYMRAAHWFDRMAPWAVGFYRRTMYRLSENPDFLEPEKPRHCETEKSIY